MKKTAVFLSLFLFSAAFAQPYNPSAKQGSGDYYLLVGTYTGSGSQGIYVYRFNSATGDVVAVSKIKTDNPSFLAVSPDEKFVYAVNENGKKGNPGSVAAFSFNKETGTLSFINRELS